MGDQLDQSTVANQERQSPAQTAADHEPPKGALVITIGFLLLLAALWANVYLTLLFRGMGGGMAH
ncbi:MAG: hypothetical protein NZ518_06540 [Dehalococcoidia bacterium]|nr:hypothetical protein [Dehalococcoidia bacterium]